MLELVAAAILCMYFLILGWSVYNIPILAAGVRHLRRSRQSVTKKEEEQRNLPSFSVVVPVRNEEKVIGRLLDALLGLRYPGHKVIVVEDGSTDNLDICLKYEKTHPEEVKVLHKKTSVGGKSAALNYAIENARGEVIGIFDADNVPANDILSNACKYFDHPNVAAVQGRTLSINSEENMLTKFISYEDAVWCEAYLRGKDVLNLFVHLKGSCQFIRRSAIERLNGFDESVLSEDMEISARLTSEGYRIKYAPDVRSWQESPSGPRQSFRQRTRWFRGTMEVAFKYGRLMSTPNRKSFDAEATLFGPFMLIISLMTFCVALSSFFAPFPAGLLWQVIMQFTAIATVVSLFVGGLALVYVTKPKKARNLLWLPFIYSYWSLQTLVAFYAVLLIVFRRPRNWAKTEKTGSKGPGLMTT